MNVDNSLQICHVVTYNNPLSFFFVMDILLLVFRRLIMFVLLGVKCDDVPQGRIQEFHLGGRKRLCVSTHIIYERGTELAFGRGPGPA